MATFLPDLCYKVPILRRSRGLSVVIVIEDQIGARMTMEQTLHAAFVTP